MKKATMSNTKDPENRSKKGCVCGGHSSRSNRSKMKKRTLKEWRKNLQEWERRIDETW